MAYISASASGFGATLRSVMANMGHAIFDFFADVSNSHARLDQIERMQRMSDETLKARFGIARTEIVAYVFRDKMVG
ncbi:MAG: hypothetical protein AAF761_10050 [Pseudomonadota bacterium]